MSDLILNNEGDLKITQKSINGFIEDIFISETFDLATTNNYQKDLILKAIKTPKSYITLFVLDQQDILIKDKEYGSEIYKELSEGITLNFLSRVKSHITNSLITANLNNNIKDIQIGLTSSNSIQLTINYTDYNIPDNIQLNI